ncbi:MAG: helix-turn-helix transcriptional regulator [Candidatus Izemoplasmatales bacterium]
MKEHAKIIKQARIKKGYTQDQLAEKLFVTKQSISKYENNHAEPNKDIKIKLENLLDIKLFNLKDKFHIQKRRLTFIFSSIILLLGISLSVITFKMISNDKLYNDKLLQYEALNSSFEELDSNYQDLTEENETLLYTYQSLISSYDTLLDDYDDLETNYDEVLKVNQDIFSQNTLDFYGISFTYRDQNIIGDYLYIDMIIHNTTDSQYILRSELFSINDLGNNLEVRIFDDSTTYGWTGKGIVSNETYSCSLRVEVTSITSCFETINEIDLYFSEQFITRINLISQ